MIFFCRKHSNTIIKFKNSKTGCKNSNLQIFCFCSFSSFYSTLSLSALTYLLIGLDRYLIVFHPSGKRHGPVHYTCIIAGLWLFCSCLVLPIRSYIRYFDLSIYIDEVLKGQALCVVGFGQHIREYNSASFVAFFALPLIIIAYLFAKVGNELKHRLESHPEEHQLEPTDENTTLRRNSSQDRLERNGETSLRATEPRRSRSFLTYLEREKVEIALMIKANRCLSIMVTLFAVCW